MQTQNAIFTNREYNKLERKNQEIKYLIDIISEWENSLNIYGLFKTNKII